MNSFWLDLGQICILKQLWFLMQTVLYQVQVGKIFIIKQQDESSLLLIGQRLVIQ